MARVRVAHEGAVGDGHVGGEGVDLHAMLVADEKQRNAASANGGLAMDLESDDRMAAAEARLRLLKVS